MHDKSQAIEMKRKLVGTGIRQADIADALGVDQAVVSRYLNGRRGIPDDFPERFERAFDSLCIERARQLLNAGGAV